MRGETEGYAGAARLGSEMDLPSVEQVADRLRDLPKQPVDPENTAFEARRAQLVDAQRKERANLLKRQETQRLEEIKARQASLPKGLRGLLSRATGQYQTKLRQIEAEAQAAERRDHAEQHALITKHLGERQALARDGQKQGLSSAFQGQTQGDPKQALVLKDEGLPHSATQLLKSPELVLDHVSQSKAAFKRVDVLRALAQRIDDPMVLQKAADQAMQSPQLLRLADDGSTHVFTTKDFQDAEHSLERAAASMSAKGGFAVNTTHIKQAIASQNVKMRRAFAADDRIVFTRNDKDIGVKNGMLGTVVTAEDGRIAVALDGEKDRLVRFNPQGFRSFDHGYAVTIHKSQGATVDQSYVLASRSMDRHLAYVAMTRHREDMQVFVNNKDRPKWAIGHEPRNRPTHMRNRDGPSIG